MLTREFAVGVETRRGVEEEFGHLFSGVFLSVLLTLHVSGVELDPGSDHALEVHSAVHSATA